MHDQNSLNRNMLPGLSTPFASPGLASRRLRRQQILKLRGRENIARLVGNGDLPTFTCPHARPCNRD